MRSPVSTILHRASNNGRKKVLSFATHERYQQGLSDVNCDFYLWNGPGIKTWNNKYGRLPKNHYILEASQMQNIAYEIMNGSVLPIEQEFDFVLSQNKFAHMPVAKIFSQLLGLPVVNLEHTLPGEDAAPSYLSMYQGYDADVHIFISELNREKWQYDRDWETQ